jgi:hypothetical protein
VTETFATLDAGFRRVAVASPSEAVLDDHELEGRQSVEGGWRRLEPAATPRLDALPSVATELGRRTLVVGSRRIPLFGPGPARSGWWSVTVRG